MHCGHALKVGFALRSRYQKSLGITGFHVAAALLATYAQANLAVKLVGVGDRPPIVQIGKQSGCRTARDEYPAWQKEANPHQQPAVGQRPHQARESAV